MSNFGKPHVECKGYLNPAVCFLIIETHTDEDTGIELIKVKDIGVLDHEKVRKTENLWRLLPKNSAVTFTPWWMNINLGELYAEGDIRLCPRTSTDRNIVVQATDCTRMSFLVGCKQ
jgi:hypothetical protein